MSYWQRIENLFLASVDLPAEEQARFLEMSCAGDAELLSEIRSLIASDPGSGVVIEALVQQEAEDFFESKALVGERLGNYRVLREIGRGGMGAVYLATRDDDEYRNEVAIKVVKRGMDTVEVLTRFRYERQILANLAHPYIARLFDGGSTQDGVPFFVMEYIEGRPIHAFCQANGLDFDQRCRLFLCVLEAVAYAHRNLVVHRDLKPSNILVTADGTPKLLDFGVAKLLGGDAGADQTLTASVRPYTPNYASPEQVRGIAVTTSTDIYSLGAVLYELLTQQRAQPIDVLTPAAIERQVCDVEVVRPSSVAKDLPSDLDNIVLMAMRKEPERRYQSAAQFAEDIQRYLDGRPVIARQDSPAYRARKFIQRNALEVAMAAIVVVSLVAGIVVSLAQARRAENALRVAESQRAIAQRETAHAEAARISESQQKMIAEQQRAIANDRSDEAQKQTAIADQRVKDILTVANRTLFDVHDAIAPLPGSMAARRTLVDTTLTYLQDLQSKANLDDKMRQTLAAAYYKVGLIQGDPEGASLQDSSGAEPNLLKAQALLQPVYQREPNDPNVTLLWLEIRTELIELNYHAGHQQDAVKAYIELLPLAHRLSQEKGCGLSCESEEAAVEANLAGDLGSDPAQALVHANRSIAILRELIAKYPAQNSLKESLGSVTSAAAGAYSHMGDMESAGESYRQSIEMREELLQSDPKNIDVNRNILIAYGNYAALLGIPWSQNLGRPEQARVYAAKAVVIARNMVDADPKDVTARHDLGMILGRLGMIDPTPAETPTALANLEEARGLIEPIAAANPKSSQLANQLGLLLEYEAYRLEALGKKDEAAVTYRKAMDLLQPFVDQNNMPSIVEYIANEEGLALLHARGGDTSVALDFANKALSSAEKLTQQTPPPTARIAGLAKAWVTLASVQSTAGDAADAKRSAQKAMELWESVKNPGILTAYRKPMADTRALLDASRVK